MRISGADVYLFNTVEGGEIDAEDGVVRMNGGIQTATYLSLFGGNEQDSGIGDDVNQWWGNTIETIPARTIRNETQYLLRSIPIISSNLQVLEKAAARDLQWLIEEGVATDVRVTVTNPALNTLKYNISVEAFGRQEDLEYSLNWLEDYQDFINRIEPEYPPDDSEPIFDHLGEPILDHQGNPILATA